MKRVLFTLLSYCFVLVGWAQTPAFDFRATDTYGNNCLYKIIDPVKKYVELWGADDTVYPYIVSTWGSTRKVTLPATIQYNGNTYQVKYLNKFPRAKPLPLADTLIISEGIEEIGRAGSVSAMMWAGGVITYLPTTLKYIHNYGFGECFGVKKFVGLENTQLVKIDNGGFNQCVSLDSMTVWKFPSTLRYLGGGALSMSHKQRELELPASLDTLDFKFIDGSGTNGISYNIKQINFLKVIRLNRPTPPYTPNVNTSTTVTPQGQTIYQFGDYGLFSYQKATYNPGPPVYYTYTLYTPDSLYTPIDGTAAYEAAAGWDMYKGKYYEQVKIGVSGYATLYLANENFEVPTGYDAFVIENITKATTPGGLDKANAKKFVAGSIIPAGQAVILKGAANQTCVYQANVSGTPVTITDNMLIGTATDQTINATGYDYYLFGNGDLGQGFYRQTGHDKSSISLKAHKAGLRVPKGSGGSAKAFVIDFDAADTYVPTGIQSVKTPQPQTDVIYDLQGRRVTHPTRGIYIMNGKKMVFN